MPKQSTTRNSTKRVYDPVEYAGLESENKGPAPGIALCMSGGGYRAMLFHTGSVWRLYEAGFLPRLDRVSSVSGVLFTPI